MEDKMIRITQFKKVILFIVCITITLLFCALANCSNQYSAPYGSDDRHWSGVPPGGPPEPPSP